MPPPPSDMDFTVGSTAEETGLDWNQQLLLDTAAPSSAAAPPIVADGPTRAEILRGITSWSRITTDVINLVSSTIRSRRASDEADNRAASALGQLQSQWGDQGSQALGAAALRQARQMIADARTGNDLATAAVFLRRAKAVQDAMALGEGSGSTLGSDVPLLVAGAVLLAGAVWYWQRSTTRRSVR